MRSRRLCNIIYLPLYSQLPTVILSWYIRAIMSNPIKRGGRPPKYSTHEEAREADLKRRRQRYNKRSVPPGLDFIAYEPQLHSNIPIDTAPQIGLRISPGIRIPPDHNIQEDDINTNNPIPSSPTRIAEPLPAEEEAEIARRIEQIRADEQEHNDEQADYEAEVTARLEAMTPADYEAAEVLKALQSIPSEGPKNVENSSQHSDYDVLPYDEFDLGNQQDNVTPPAVHTENPQTVQRSPQNRTPSGKRSPLSQSSGNTSRRGPSFPVQKNTLLSWMNPSVNASPTSRAPSTSLTVAVPCPSVQPREAPSPSPIKAEFPIVPTECPIGEMPEPAPQVSSEVLSPAPPANPNPGERTAFKLAKQLRGFQGCTHAQHREAGQKHEEHHQRPDVHSECSSIPEITSIFRGSRAAPLPDVLNPNPRITCS